MGWSLGYDSNWNRDVGYGVPATCDHPGCGKRIDRGLSYVCGGHPYGGESGCGLFFCGDHLRYAGSDGQQVCERCETGLDVVDPFDPTPDHADWVNHKLTDESWALWRAENPAAVASMSTTPASPELGGDEGRKAEVHPSPTTGAEQ